MECLKAHIKNYGDLNSHVVRCIVKHTFNKKQIKVAFWVKGWEDVQTAVQVALVSLDFEMQYTPAPPLQPERNVIESLAAVLATFQ